MMTLPVTELDEVEDRPPAWRRLLAIPARLLGALFLPDRTMPQVVAERRYGAPFLFVIACGLFSAWAVGPRLDMSFLALGPPPGAAGAPPAPQQQMSDHDLDEMVQKAQSQAQMMMVIKAVALSPLSILAIALLTLLAGRYAGGKTSGIGALAAASYAFTPLGVKSLLTGVVATARTTITPMELPKLLPFGFIGPSGGGPLKFLVFDPFVVWSAVLLGFGLHAASHMSKRRAFVIVLVCFCLFQLLSGGAGPDMPAGGPMMRGPQS